MKLWKRVGRPLPACWLLLMEATGTSEAVMNDSSLLLRSENRLQLREKAGGDKTQTADPLSIKQTPPGRLAQHWLLE